MEKSTEKIVEDFMNAVRVRVIQQNKLPLMVIAADATGVISVMGVETLPPHVAKEVLEQVLAGFDKSVTRYFMNVGDSNTEIKR